MDGWSYIYIYGWMGGWGVSEWYVVRRSERERVCVSVCVYVSLRLSSFFFLFFLGSMGVVVASCLL